jgi:excisionase family DNA binding protein
MTDRLLTLRAAAAVLGCGLTSVKRRVAAGELPVFRDGRLVRVREGDLARYVAERVQRRAATPSDVPPGSDLPAEGRLWD